MSYLCILGIIILSFTQVYRFNFIVNVFNEKELSIKSITKPMAGWLIGILFGVIAAASIYLWQIPKYYTQVIDGICYLYEIINEIINIGNIRFDACKASADEKITDSLKEQISKTRQDSRIGAEDIDKTIKRIILAPDKTVTIRFKNGKEFSERIV